MNKPTYTLDEWLEINFRKLREGKITPEDLEYDLRCELDERGYQLVEDDED